MDVQTHYFDDASPEHTDAVLSLVSKTLETNKAIRYVVVATTQGDTGVAAARRFSDWNVIVVTHQTGFIAPNFNELTKESRREIEDAGATILTTTHAFAGVGRSLRKQFDTWSVPEIFSIAYRTLGQGTKVCAEIALMAADSGLIPVDEDVICVGGTGRGADTAWIVRPTYTNTFADLQLKACICKPLEF
ncbi:MAG: hypothetical protein JSW61_03125 [Candidatus Thorarchaeota archaeon]|nr:MAG: hypothetical protein JSW61_03125 [Candidatus Thorarchaeota archaeon]